MLEVSKRCSSVLPALSVCWECHDVCFEFKSPAIINAPFWLIRASRSACKGIVLGLLNRGNVDYFAAKFNLYGCRVHGSWSEYLLMYNISSYQDCCAL